MAQCELATSSFYMIHSNPWELKLAGPFIMAGWGSLNAKLYIPSTLLTIEKSCSAKLFGQIKNALVSGRLKVS